MVEIAGMDEIREAAVWMRDLTLQMAEDYGLSDRVEVEFGTAAGSCHFYHALLEQHKIRYGMLGLWRAWSEGFSEYASWRQLWTEDTMKYRAAFWATAIHEFAHVLQMERERRLKGAAHTDRWAMAVRELQGKYPCPITSQPRRVASDWVRETMSKYGMM
jgi:hypothetical protein